MPYLMESDHVLFAYIALMLAVLTGAIIGTIRQRNERKPRYVLAMILCFLVYFGLFELLPILLGPLLVNPEQIRDIDLAITLS